MYGQGNKTGNTEVLFRASRDDGQTFDPDINLSNSTTFNSEGPKVTAYEDNVNVGWSEGGNQISRESTDMLVKVNDSFSHVSVTNRNGCIQVFVPYTNNNTSK